MSLIHVFCQSKGGVGKTFCALMYAQYLREKKPGDLLIYDSDPTNQSLNSYKDLHARSVNLLRNQKQVNVNDFDQLYERMLIDLEESGGFDEGASTKDVIIDTGSSIYLQMRSYFFEGDQAVISDLAERGYKLIFHMPIVGGQPREDSVESVRNMIQSFTLAKFIVWVNNYPLPLIGPKDDYTKPEDFFGEEEMNSILAFIDIPYLADESSLKPLFQLVLKDKLTFNQVINDPTGSMQINKRPVMSLDRRRLNAIKNSIFSKIAVLDNVL